MNILNNNVRQKGVFEKLTFPVVSLAAALLFPQELQSATGQVDKDSASTNSPSLTNSVALFAQEQKVKDLDLLSTYRKKVDLASTKLPKEEQERLNTIVQAEAVTNTFSAEFSTKLKSQDGREAAMSIVEHILTVELPRLLSMRTPQAIATSITNLASAAKSQPIVINQIKKLLFESPADFTRDHVCVYTLGALENRSQLLEIARYHPDKRCAEEAIAQLGRNTPRIKEWLLEDRRSFSNKVAEVGAQLRTNSKLISSIHEAYLILQDKDTQLTRYQDLVTKLQKDLDEQSMKAATALANAQTAQKEAALTKARLDEERERDIVKVDGRQYRKYQLVGELTGKGYGQGVDLEIRRSTGVPIMVFYPEVASQTTKIEVRAYNVVFARLAHGSIIPEDEPSQIKIMAPQNVRVQFFAVKPEDGKPTQYGNCTQEWVQFMEEKRKENEQRARRQDRENRRL